MIWLLLAGYLAGIIALLHPYRVYVFDWDAPAPLCWVAAFLLAMGWPLWVLMLWRKTFLRAQFA